MALPVITPRTEITRAYKNIEDALGGIEGDVTALDGRLTTAESEINTAQVDINTAEADILALDSRIDNRELHTFKGAAELSTLTGSALQSSLASFPTISIATGTIGRAVGSILIPEIWKGRSITPRYYWSISGTSTANIVLKLYYTIKALAEGIGTETTESKTVSPNLGLAFRFYTTNFTNISIASDRLLLGFGLERTGGGADTNTGNFHILGMDFLLV